MSGNADQINELRLHRLKLLEEHYKEIGRLRGELHTSLREIDLKIAKVGNRDAKLPCLVRRTPGPQLTIYHAADASCGRVHDRRNFRKLPEVDARDASPYVWLERCSACDWGRAARVHGKRLLDD
ncbi:hypothetical protein [Streptomyces laurentii]|uniref:hypothetical protein n=1 Tax=Streptomyces laurentii TaxID=39478 RepID=UPI0036AF9220